MGERAGMGRDGPKRGGGLWTRGGRAVEEAFSKDTRAQMLSPFRTQSTFNPLLPTPIWTSPPYPYIMGPIRGSHFTRGTE